MAFQKGHKPWNKNKKGPTGILHPMWGKKHTLESKRKIGKATKSRLSKKENHPLFGKKHRSESKLKMSIAQLKRLSSGLHPNWRGGSRGWWKNAVLKRDGYKCQKCGNNDRRVLVTDHIKSKVIYPELSLDLKNGITLCANCHLVKTWSEDKEFREWMSKNRWSKNKRFHG